MTPTAPIVGRDAERAEIERALAEAQGGRGRLVLVSGSAGIGKSTLAEAAIAAAHGRGMTILRGYAVDHLGAPPLWPWLRALQGRPGVAELPTADADASDAAARFGLFVAITDLLHEQMAGGALAVLEDLHWADRASVLLLRHVAGELAAFPLAVLATYRDGVVGPLDEMMADLVRGPATTVVPLSGMSGEEVAAWLPQLTGRFDADAAAALHAATGGNPLLVRLVAGELLASADGDVATLIAGRPRLRHIVASRVSRLMPGIREVVEAASVLGERIDPVIVAAMVGRDVTADLEQARVAGVLRVLDGIAFEHALVRDAVYAELPTERRAELHRAAALALEALDVDVPGTIAAHWQRAGALDRCRPWAERADEAARAALAYDEATRYAALAVTCARRTRADDMTVAHLLVRLAEAQHLDGFVEPAAHTCVEAAGLAEAAERPELLAAAALVVHGSGHPAVVELIGPLCRRALAALPADEHALRARLMAQWAVTVAEAEGGSKPAELAAEALAEAERAGDGGAILEAIAARHLAITVPDTVTERLELGRRAVELGERANRPMAALWGHLWRLDAALQLGTMREVDRELRAVDRSAHERGSALARWHYLRYRATLAALTGDFPAAGEADAEAQALAERVGDISMLGLSFAFQIQAALVRGDPAALPAGIDEMMHAAPPMPLVRVSVPQVLAVRGRTDEARAAFEQFRELPQTFPRGVRWAGTLAQLGATAIMLEDADVAAAVHDRLEPFAQYYTGDGSGGVFAHGSTARLLGDLARVAGWYDIARTHYRAAVAMNARIGARPFTALSRLGWAQTLLASNQDLAEAATLIQPAAAEFRRLDMPGPLASATAVIARLESARRTASPLSAREREVAELVGQALANRDIAQRLVLSERTVETHVRSILAKLGYTRRTQIAAWVLTADR